MTYDLLDRQSVCNLDFWIEGRVHQGQPNHHRSYRKVMVCLEPIHEFLKCEIPVNVEMIPQSPLDIAILSGEEVMCVRFITATSELVGLTFCLAAAIGSEKPKNGKARLTKPFLYCSISVLPSMICPDARSVSYRLQIAYQEEGSPCKALDIQDR